MKQYHNSEIYYGVYPWRIMLNNAVSNGFSTVLEFDVNTRDRTIGHEGQKEILTRYPQGTQSLQNSRNKTILPSGLHLTAREVEVASLIAGGESNSAIASQLGIKAKTVECHLKNIYQKLYIHNRTQLMSWVVNGKGIKSCSTPP